MPSARNAAMLLALAAIPLASAASQAPPTDDRESVRRAALDYVEGFYEGDSTRHIRSIRPEVYKFGFFIPRDSARYEGRQMRWSEFHAYTRRVRENRSFTPATAPRDVVIFEVLDQTASAKVTAAWGIDYLLLARFDGHWMITHVLWQTPPRAPAAATRD